MKLFLWIKRLSIAIKITFWSIVGSLIALFGLFPFFGMGWPKPPAELASAEKAIILDLHKQALYGYEKGKLRHRFLIETGMVHHETPTGRFEIARKVEHYHSNTYNAPMPFSLFFVPERGIAMHTGLNILPHWIYKHLFGSPPSLGSHGCVHVGLVDSISLYQWAQVGTPVVVVSRQANY